MMKMQNKLKEWLLASNPWTEYNTRVEILGQDTKSEEVINARKEMVKHPLVNGLLKELEDWPGAALKRHNDAKHLTHKLAFIADIGVGIENPTIKKVVKKIFDQQSDSGPMRILVNIPKHFGGSGKDELSWILCDSPTVLYSLIKFGLEDDSRVTKAIEYFININRENGWPCTAAEAFGKFKGPGKREDPCPYANLLMVKVLANTDKWKASKAAKIGIQTLLELWDDRKQRKPFLFAMGSRFAKLKTPFIWYDILHLTEVLTRFDHLKSDKRVLEMLDIIQKKADENGLFKAESVWREFKEWDFGHKREPSPWITYQVYRILNRLE